jgi:hypothetical protein
MKTYPLTYTLLLIIAILTGQGCSVLQPNKSKAQVNIKKLDLVKQVAYTTDLYLVKTNVPAAIDSNNKVISIVGVPSIVQMESAKNSISTTNFHDIDKAIQSVQKEDKRVDDNIVKEASKVPALEQELSEYKSWFGLGGIFQSIKHFSMWLLVAGIIFFILRILATANPVTAAIFGIIESIVSWIVKGIHILIPRAVEMVTHSNSALKKVVTAVENNQSIVELKTELKDKMSTAEKTIIKELKL